MTLQKIADRDDETRRQSGHRWPTRQIQSLVRRWRRRRVRDLLFDRRYLLLQPFGEIGGNLAPIGRFFEDSIKIGLQLTHVRLETGFIGEFEGRNSVILNSPFHVEGDQFARQPANLSGWRPSVRELLEFCEPTLNLLFVLIVALSDGDSRIRCEGDNSDEDNCA